MTSGVELAAWWTLLSSVKVLLLPAYRSTDFDVHRNWLAVTHSHALGQWYRANESEWTLDYPPLFAWFEYGLGCVGRYFDAAMLDVRNVGYASGATVLFQRLSVVAADLLLYAAAARLALTLRLSLLHTRLLLLFLGLNAGLIVVDHIHFQYNGFLFGILFLSVDALLSERFVLGAFYFAALLNFKHIFLYVAPVYVVYLLRAYCLHEHWRLKSAAQRLCALGLCVLAVFGVSFGPFVLAGGISELEPIVKRLFPFRRGLCHAYWAPNVWALYTVSDKVAVAAVARWGGAAANGSLGAARFTGGLVQEDWHFTVLPDVQPSVTFLLTAAAMVPCLVRLWQRRCSVLSALVVAALCSFQLGWHVHEKAILMATLPLGVLCFVQWARGNVWWAARRLPLLCALAHYSLLPLIFTWPDMLVARVVVVAFGAFGRHFAPAGSCPQRGTVAQRLERVYALGLVGLDLYCVALHRALGLTDRLPFLPLLLTSSYCAVGLLYCSLAIYYHLLFADSALSLQRVAERSRLVKPKKN